MNPERWLVVTVDLDSRDLLDLAAAELIALGGSSVVEQPGSVSTYLPPTGDPSTLMGAARERLASALPPGTELNLSWKWQDNEDWAREWKNGLQPRQITERLVVKPTWTEWDRSSDELIIDIDPQMAFGTGEHATTRGCLRLLDAALRPGDRVLDVGSGSAILSIGAALLGAAEVTAVEYDPDANLNARDNLVQNGVDRRVTIIEAMADAALLADLGTYDVIVANILSGVIRPLFPAFRAALGRRATGKLIVSGILQSEADEVLAAASAAGFTLVSEDREDEWWSGLLKQNLEC
ncbi:MAG: 50S ribosomal protein L11 methyltransferase [Gemmatimonadetes bacterium]|nr:50S ribosomal protein L11 methyltransferase [Gemmatimonadota bacterium]